MAISSRMLPGTLLLHRLLVRKLEQLASLCSFDPSSPSHKLDHTISPLEPGGPVWCDVGWKTSENHPNPVNSG